MAKATTKIISTSRPVKTSCKNTKVRTASGECAPERKPMMKKGGSTKSFPDLNNDGKVTKADILIGKKVIPKAEVGGATESCGPGKPKGCGYAKAQRKNSRSQMRSHIGPVVAKVLTTAATIGGLAYGAMKGKKMLENKKSGGTTRSLKKSQMGGANTMGSYDPGSGIQTSNMPSPQAKFGGSTHPGFKAVQSKIAAKQGISKEAAGAILASSARKASAKAKAANPRLKKVK